MRWESDQELGREVVRCLKEQPPGAIHLRHIMHLIALPENQRRRLRRILKQLVVEGRLIAEGRGRYTLPGNSLERVGTLEIRGRWMELLSEEDHRPLMRIRFDDRGGALAGDRVRAVVLRRRTAGEEGKVIEILNRGMRPVVGLVRRQRGKLLINPERDGYQNPIRLAKESESKLDDGLLVAVAVDDPLPRIRPIGRLLRILGEPGTLNAELARLELNHQLGTPFPPAVEREIALSAWPDPALSQRNDLRHVPHVTVDPVDAKDFDDAVYVERTSDGGFRLLVSIADVSAYVPAGSAMNAEALRRGCSVYFPARVYPMLPAALSEDHCSLQPGRDKLAMTVELVLDRSGARQDARFTRSLIRSARRLHYRQVQDVLDGREPNGVSPVESRLLKDLADCGQILNGRLTQRGFMELDVPETEFDLDDSKRPVNMKPAERLFSHRMIAAFMIAANEAVAELLTAAGAPVVYRVHPPPDHEKLELFSRQVQALGMKPTFGSGATPPQLSDFLGSVKQAALSQPLSMLLLRSLMQARYAADKNAHFGLASECYLHFTSPIRRYPDLAVHLQLAHLLSRVGSNGIALSAAMPRLTDWPLDLAAAVNIAAECTRAERRAVEAERDAASLYAAEYMRAHVGQVFDGVISHVVEWGVFVRLDPCGAEGLIHVSRLVDDYYLFDPEKMALCGRRNARCFRLGQRLRVRVDDVNLALGQVDLVPVQGK